MSVGVSQEFPADRDHDLAVNGLRKPITGSPFVTGPFLAAAARRRWRLWTTTAVAGVVAAIALSAASPPAYTATTTVRLGHPPSSNATEAMRTDEELLKTTAVARGALERLGVRKRATAFRKEYDGRSVSPELLQVTARGDTSVEAVRSADAVAQSLLAFRADELQRQSQLTVQALQEREGPVLTELNDVSSKINSAAAQATSDPAVRAFGDLLTRRVTLNDQLASLRQRAQSVATETRTVIDKSGIVDPASPNDRSPVKAMILNAAAGAVGGVLLGLGWIVGTAILSDRVRRRDDVAAALGAPVSVSVGNLRGGRRRQRRRFLAYLSRPDGDLVRITGHLRSCIGRAGPGKPSLLVVSVKSDWASAMAVAATAADLAARGHGVLLGDLSQESVLARILGVPSDTTSEVHPRHSDSPIWVTLPTLKRRAPDLEVQDAWTEADVVLVLTSLDPGVGAEHLLEWGTTAVVVVTAGRATGTELHATSQMLHGAGVQLHSAVLIGADNDDETTGMLHRSLTSGPLEPLPMWAAH